MLSLLEIRLKGNQGLHVVACVVRLLVLTPQQQGRKWKQLLTNRACRAAGIGSEASASVECSAVLTDTTCLRSAAATAAFIPCTRRGSLCFQDF